MAAALVGEYGHEVVEHGDSDTLARYISRGRISQGLEEILAQQPVVVVVSGNVESTGRYPDLPAPSRSPGG